VTLMGKVFTGSWLGPCVVGWALGSVAATARQLVSNPLRLGIPGKDCLDFVWIWLTSKFAISGALARSYDYMVFSGAGPAIAGTNGCILEHFDYPPTLLLLTFPLGLMPYPVAWATWITATLCFYLAALVTIIPCPATIIVALTLYPVFINISLGHTGFLTAGLIGFALISIPRRPWLSGIFIGLLTYKPQFGVLFPLALVASRNWRALLSAVLTSVVLAVAAGTAFGFQVWPAFFGALSDRASILAENSSLAIYLVSVFGFLRWFGVGAGTAWIVQSIATAIAAAAVCVLWARPIPHTLKAAVFSIGAVMASPHAYPYDLCILSLAAAFLAKDGLSRGIARGEKTAMIACWVGTALMSLGSFASPIPITVSAGLLILVLRRARRLGAESVAGSPEEPGADLLATQP
jgi:Glycosyltransferase family 87